MKVAIAGAGYTDFRSITPEVSWKELMCKAASGAYHYLHMEEFT